jgi:hypothetical protein
MHPGSRLLWGCSTPTAILSQSKCQKMVTFQFNLQSGKKRKIVWVEDDSLFFFVKIHWWKRRFETVRCRNATISYFVVKVLGEVFARFHAATVNLDSCMQNSLLGLLVWIICEQSPWCWRKWWACSSLCSTSVSPFFCLLWAEHAIQTPCTAHAFFPERLSNYC